MGAGRRWRRLGAGVVALLAMTGCSDADGDEVPTAAATPRVSETTTDSPSESPAPGPTPWPEPTRPAAMERDDIEGAKAAAEYFLALYPYIFATGDLKEWQRMSHQECQFCAGAADRVDELSAKGGFALGGELEVENVFAQGPDGSNGEYRVGLMVRESPSTEFSNDGKEMLTLSGGRAQYSFALHWSDEGWKVLRGAFESLER